MSNIDLSSLVDAERGYINPEIYTSEDIYQLELEKVFGRCWLFLAHDSQIPKPGDFIQTYMGEDPVLVVRQRDMTVKAFLNQCRHRGMRICRADLGNLKAFTCTYHGWTYDTAGKLINIPNESVAGLENMDKGDWGPTKVAQLANHKGYIFGTWDATAPDFETYLGDMRWYFDAWCDLWEGGTEIVDGGMRWVIDGNWKLAAEQFGSDTSHGPITHASAAMVGAPTGADPGNHGEKMAGWLQNLRQFASPNGHGTVVNIGGGMFQGVVGATAAEEAAITPFWEESMDAGVERVGALRSQGMGGGGHATIFPNFSYLAMNRTMRVWQPRGPGQMEVFTWTSVPVGAPQEVKDAIRRLSIRGFSPAGIFEADDGENWNEIQKVLKGWMARQKPLNTQQGMGRSKIDADGLPGRTSPGFSEDAARHFYQRWVNLLAAKTWNDLDALTRTDPHIPAK
ncbi:MAG: aromatic ring-hydroxylating dioxygenase subunit alpha [Rhodococcus sp. (in: high G+C Gram-positive bacteria)]